jgi:hypothetical protein
MQVVCRNPRLSTLLKHLPYTAAAPGLSHFCGAAYPKQPQIGWKHAAKYITTAATSAGASHAGTAAAAAATAAAAEMPVVYHPLYSAPQLAAGHRFPMQVFARIHDRLLQQGIIHPSQVGAWQLLLGEAHTKVNAAARFCTVLMFFKL